MEFKMWILILLTISHQAIAEILLYFPGEPKPLHTLTDVPSSFGGLIPSTGIVAKVWYASPADGCQLIEPPDLRNYSQTWMALVSRDNCSFELKIRNAQASNYDGVIVHNVGSDDVLEMYVENATGIHIPSVFIGETDAFNLRRIFILYSFYYYVVITPNYPFNYPNLLLITTTIVIIIFIIAMLARVINYIIYHYRRHRQTRRMYSINKVLLKHKFGDGHLYKELEVCSDSNTEKYTRHEQHT